MEQLNLPFRLGMDYEEMEFDLEILPDRIQGYDSYIYLGKFNNFLNYNTDRIELLFRMDVLEGIIISLDYKSQEDYSQLIIKMKHLFGSFQIVYENNYSLHKFEILEKAIIWCFYNNDIIVIIFSKPYFVIVGKQNFMSFKFK